MIKREREGGSGTVGGKIKDKDTSDKIYEVYLS